MTDAQARRLSVAPAVPERAGDHRYWCGVQGSGRALAISEAAHRHDGLTLVVNC